MRQRTDMEKQHTKKSSLVFLPVIFMGSLLFALVSCGAVGQIPGGPFQPSQDGTAVTAGGSPTAGSPTKTTGTSGAITRAAAQVDSTGTATNGGAGVPPQEKRIATNPVTSRANTAAAILGSRRAVNLGSRGGI